jgi:hypothetical protein
MLLLYCIEVSFSNLRRNFNVLRDLLSGMKRFRELRKSVASISQKVLTDNLREEVHRHHHRENDDRRREGRQGKGLENAHAPAQRTNGYDLIQTPLPPIKPYPINASSIGDHGPASPLLFS